MKSAPMLFVGCALWISALQPAGAAVDQVSVSVHQQFLTAVLVEFERQPEQAIDELRQHLEDFPGWYRGRLELARLYFRHGNYPAARSNVKQVVQQVTLPPKVKRNVLVFYRQILDAERHNTQQMKPVSEKHWLVSGRLGIAYGYDSNANTGPEDQDIGVTNLRLSLDALEKSDQYRALQLALRADRRFSLGSGEGNLQWRNRLYLFDRHYRHQKRANLSSYRLYSGASWNLPTGIQVATRLRLQQLHYDVDSRINQVGLEPGLTWVDGAHSVRAHYLYSQRRYRGDASREKNGHLQELGIRYGYRFDNSWQAKLGGRLIETDTRSERHSYQAWEVEGQLSYQTRSDLMLWTQLRYRNTDYQAPEKPYYDDARSEQYLTARAGMRYKVTPDLSLDLVLSGYRNHANHKLHDYERKQAELRLSWLF